MVIYGIYNAETIEKIVNTLEKMLNKATLNERLFVGKLTYCFNWYLLEEGVVHYVINLILYTNTLKKKYNKMYEMLIHRLDLYANAIRILLEGLFTNFSFASGKIKRNFR